MKKLFFALLAVVAIAFSGCKPPYSFMIENNYSKNAIVLLSDKENCSSINAAIDVTLAEPGKVYGGNLDLKGKYAIVYVCETIVPNGDETLEGYVRKASFDLNQHLGWDVVTITISSDGKPGIKDEKL